MLKFLGSSVLGNGDDVEISKSKYESEAAVRKPKEEESEATRLKLLRQECTRPYQRNLKRRRLKFRGRSSGCLAARRALLGLGRSFLQAQWPSEDYLYKHRLQTPARSSLTTTSSSLLLSTLFYFLTSFCSTISSQNTLSALLCPAGNTFVFRQFY
jgi:hypothetical protein